MDVVHHAAIGGIGALALAARNQELAGIAFLAGSVFPDLDVAFMAGGKRAYLKYHQGPTHSLILSPLFAGLIAFPLFRFLSADAAVFLSALVALWIHVALDLANTFGIALLWPFSRKRLCLDAVFFVDLTLWAMTLSAGAASCLVESTWIAWVYAAASMSYILLKWRLKSHVRRKVRCKLAIPSSWHPFHFFILEEREGAIRTYLYNVWNRTSTDEESYDKVPEEHQRLASASALYRDMKGIARYFGVTEVEERNGTTTIRARDLGIRNFGGRFSRTVLTFGRAGNLMHEVADI